MQPLPRIGFYDSHHDPSGLSCYTLHFSQQGVNFEKKDCLCTDHKAISGLGWLPDYAVLHPSYSSIRCPSSLRFVVQNHPGTHFYVAMLSFNDALINRIMNIVGRRENVTYIGYATNSSRGIEPVTLLNDICDRIKSIG